MQQYLNFYQFCHCKHFKWPSVSQVLFYSPPLERFCWSQSNISNRYAKQNLYLQNILLGRTWKERPRNIVSESSRKKTCNCFCNALISSHRMLARSQRSVNLKS